MAQLHSLFLKFDEKLAVNDSKKERMKSSRDHVRDVIRQHFRENHQGITPKFYMQGSYKMGTTIRTNDDTCDIDDGVYFEKLPEDVSCRTAQKWVYDAVCEITQEVQHRKKCISVNYKRGDEDYYNIDLPVYKLDGAKSVHPFLAVKNEDWREDDPKLMVEWFRSKKKDKEQMVRIVRYLKAWCDNQSIKMPPGIAMTILVANNFRPNEDDDVALRFTLARIVSVLNSDFKCVVPVVPFDDLFAEYDEQKRKSIIDKMESLIDSMRRASDEPNELKASQIMQKHFGDRFPKGRDVCESKVNQESVQAVAKTSKPYAGEW